MLHLVTKVSSTVFVVFVNFLTLLLKIFHAIFPAKFKYPERPKDAQWTNSSLESYRNIGDPLADRCYKILLDEYNNRFPQDFDIIEEIEKRGIRERIEKQSPSPFLDLWTSISTVPEWVDFDRINRGRLWYLKVGFPGGAFVLATSSLVQSYGAAKGSQVLTETGRLNDDVVKRLFETGDFLHKIVKPNGLRRGKGGYKATLQVRMLHCAIRNFLLTRQKKWDVDHLGIPINQEDLTGTICLFTSIMIYGLAKLGYQLDHDGIDDYIHLWRYVGYLLGIREELIPTNLQESVAIAYGIHEHQWKPTQGSNALIQSLFKSLHLRIKYFFLPSQFWQQLSRFLIGHQAADELGLIPQDKFWYMAVLGFSAIIKLQSFTHHYLPLCTWMTINLGMIFWDIFMMLNLAGRSVDYKMKRY